MKPYSNLILFILIGLIVILVNICIYDHNRIKSLENTIASYDRNMLQEEKHILDVGITSGVLTQMEYSDKPALPHVVEQAAWGKALDENPSLRKLGDFLP